MLGMSENGISRRHPVYVFLDNLQSVLILGGLLGFALWASPHVFIYCMSWYCDHQAEKERTERDKIREKGRAAEAEIRKIQNTELERMRQLNAQAEEERRTQMEAQEKIKAQKRIEERQKRSVDDANKAALGDF